jgi:hypothetical protein
VAATHPVRGRLRRGAPRVGSCGSALLTGLASYGSMCVGGTPNLGLPGGGVSALIK